MPIIVLRKVNKALIKYFDLNKAERREFHELLQIREKREIEIERKRILKKRFP